ncbi:DUF1801 domain-containing protein [Robiginitomaculum antarcticum]|uniref:DUF1801 domain-containing protein n=1 Tax=Robiginitomaculum antarcticum TaxID=437507 RepID=UPI00036E9FE2|nr:DUF1801 domain-containing protein [Robiginitomaculum antarcticum]
MSENKTKPTPQSPANFVAAIEDPIKRADCQILLGLMERLSGYPPVMWGKIVGFGGYHYIYESGREGDFFRIGFAPRAQDLSIYIIAGYEELSEELSQLGKHKFGKSCLYIKRLSHVDLEVFEEIVLKGLAIMGQKYPDDKWT